MVCIINIEGGTGHIGSHKNCNDFVEHILLLNLKLVIERETYVKSMLSHS